MIYPLWGLNHQKTYPNQNIRYCDSGELVILIISMSIINRVADVDWRLS